MCCQRTNDKMKYTHQANSPENRADEDEYNMQQIYYYVTFSVENKNKTTKSNAAILVNMACIQPSCKEDWWKKNKFYRRMRSPFFGISSFQLMRGGI